MISSIFYVLLHIYVVVVLVGIAGRTFELIFERGCDEGMGAMRYVAILCVWPAAVLVILARRVISRYKRREANND